MNKIMHEDWPHMEPSQLADILILILTIFGQIGASGWISWLSTILSGNIGAEFSAIYGYVRVNDFFERLTEMSLFYQTHFENSHHLED
jgi:hypothetical protein